MYDSYCLEEPLPLDSAAEGGGPFAMMVARDKIQVMMGACRVWALALYGLKITRRFIWSPDVPKDFPR